MIRNEEQHSPVLYYTLGIIFFAVLLLQNTNILSLKIGSAYPLLLLPMVICVACFLGEWVGFWFSFASGIALDTLAARSSVFNTIMFVLIGTAAGFVFHYLLNKNIKAVFVAGLGFSLIYYLCKWLFLYVIKGDQSWNYYLMRYAIPSAFYTALTIIPIYFIIKKIIKINVIKH